MRLMISIFFTVLSVKSFSQTQELKPSDLMKYAYVFEIRGARALGAGADTLRKRIAESQFFMLGEEHSSAQISEMTDALLPYFSTNGYKNFGLEIGPVTSEILKREIKENHSLRSFNKAFYDKHKDIPVPFFESEKD